MSKIYAIINKESIVEEIVEIDKAIRRVSYIEIPEYDTLLLEKRYDGTVISESYKDKFKDVQIKPIRVITDEAFADRLATYNALGKIAASTNQDVMGFNLLLSKKSAINLDSPLMPIAMASLMSENIITEAQRDELLKDGLQDEAA